jgi:hypothetical protein
MSESQGAPLYSPMFFFWPVVFLLLAFAYATLFPKARNG